MGFEERHIKVRRKDKVVKVVISRTEGSDGTAKCKCQTEQLTNVNNPAIEFTDYCPIMNNLVFGP